MRIYMWIFVILNLLNGTFMLVAPNAWYETIPGVSDTGPFNSHFVRDIGIAFVASSIGIGMSLANQKQYRLSAAIVGLFFLAGHALFHLIMVVMHRPEFAIVLRELALIIGPAVIAMAWLIAQLVRQNRTDSTRPTGVQT